MKVGGLTMEIFRVSKCTVLLASGFFLLSACEGFDLVGSLDGRSTADDITRSVASRPEPDDRGLIIYPNYQVIVARHGDSMDDLAVRVGMSGEDLARYNGVDPLYFPRVGELMALPKGVVIPLQGSEDPEVGTSNLEAIASFAIDRGNPRTASVQGGAVPIRHIVEPGETVYSISRLYDVSVKSLGSWNGLGKDLGVRSGQALLIPVVGDNTAEKKTTGAAESSPGQGSVTPIPPSAIAPLPKKIQTVEIPESPNLAATRTKPGASGKMTKPVSGKVLRGYSGKPGGNEGLDFAAKQGSGVKAAESGEVALVSSAAANSKIVLLRHPDNLYTVYSNVMDVSVRKGEQVKRGQSIAKAAGGSPGFVHFEVRRGTQSVDPAPFF